MPIQLHLPGGLPFSFPHLLLVGVTIFWVLMLIMSLHSFYFFKYTNKSDGKDKALDQDVSSSERLGALPRG